jgi:sugar phosphate isomerase/epimerase
VRLAYSTLACPGWTLERCAEAALEYGYEGLELRLLDGELLRPDLDAAGRRRVSEVCRAAGLPVVAVDSGVQLAVLDPVTRARELEAGLAFLELAAGWGSGLVRVFGGPFGGLPEATSEAGWLAAAADTLGALAERGEALGVAVALETHDLFSSSRPVARVLEAVPSRAAGALWDTLHPRRVGEAAGETLERLGDRLLHVHVKDGRPGPGGGERWDLAMLGEGAVSMAEILAALWARGYDGWLSVEWEKHWHPGLAEPEVALPMHAARLRALLRALP